MKKPTTVSFLAKDAKTALVGLGKIITPRATEPALRCIHLSADRKAPDTVRLRGTDQESYLELALPATRPTSLPDCLLPIKEFRDILKGCAATDQIDLTVEAKDSLIVTRLSSGSEIPHRLAVPLVTGFPETSWLRGSSMPLDDYAKDALLQTMACSSRDPLRPVLQGACLDGGHTMVGTDGRHLLRCNSMNLPVKGKVILPYRKVLDWKPIRETEDWTLIIDKDRYQLAGTNWCLTGKLIEGNYPNWKTVLPPDSAFSSTVTIPEDTLDTLITTIHQLPGERLQHKPIGLQIRESGLSLLARGDTNLQHTETPVANTTVKGRDTTVFLNREYLLKALTFGLNQIEVADEEGPVRIRHQGSAQRDMILMPVRGADVSTASMSRDSRDRIAPASVTQPKPKPTQPMKKQTPTNGSPNGSPTRTPTPPNAEDELTPLEQVEADIDHVKGLLRQATSGMAQLTTALRQVKADQRTTAKEIRHVRSTIRTLQKVDL